MSAVDLKPDQINTQYTNLIEQLFYGIENERNILTNIHNKFHELKTEIDKDEKINEKISTLENDLKKVLTVNASLTKLIHEYVNNEQNDLNTFFDDVPPITTIGGGFVTDELYAEPIIASQKLEHGIAGGGKNRDYFPEKFYYLSDMEGGDEDETDESEESDESDDN
jgi:hypothetical protein